MDVLPAGLTRQLNRFSKRSHRLLSLFLLYVVVELRRLWRFKRLLKRLQARSYIHKGGEGFLRSALNMLTDGKALSIDVDVFERYTAEGNTSSVGYGGGPLNWQRMYSWWAWGIGRPFDPPHDAELHAHLLQGTDLCCRMMGIEGPPTNSLATAVPALSPFGFGICEVRATFKPLPMRAFLRAFQAMTRLLIRALGFRQIIEPMPSGDLICWTNVQPRHGGKLSGRPPVVFLHGLGLGAFTYLPLFIGSDCQDWRAGGCIIVELLNMTSASELLDGRPDVMHYADAIGRLLREQLGYGEFEYDIVCHSLSAFLAATLCNEGSPCRPRRSVLIDPVCFLEGIEVVGRFPFRTVEECNTFADTTVLFPEFLPRFLRRLLGHMFRQFVCRDIFTQYSLLRWNGTDATSILWHTTTAEALVCLSDDDNFVPSERVARHVTAHFPRLSLYRMPGKDHGSFVIESSVRRELLECITKFLAE